MRTGLRILPLLVLLGCSEAVYPPRPPTVPGPPVVDPPSSRVVLHLVVSELGLRQLLEAAVPQAGEGTFTLVGSRRYTWRRQPFAIRFDGALGKIAIRSQAQGEAQLPVTTARFSLVVEAEAQPVLTADYRAMLQAPVVRVTSDDPLLRIAEWGAGVMSTIREALEQQLRELRIDLRPVLEEAYGRLAQPLEFTVGQARACACLGLQGVEAGPTVLAGGLEKDLALLVAPSVTLPCNAPPVQPAALPPLHNVASVPTGLFEVTVPIAAGYDELQKAMAQAFTGGRLYFSQEHPGLYLERPEVYASGGEVVVKLHLDGQVRRGLTMRLSGDLFLVGQPQVRDNFLEVPNLQPTIETRSALLRLKTALDADAIRDEVRRSLRLDISARLQPVKARLSKDLSLSRPQLMSQGPSVCLQADLGRVEVTGVYAHDSYLRLYVKVQARAAAHIPCRQ